MDLKDRKDRLAEISKENEKQIDFPLLKAMPIQLDLLGRLENSVNHFLYDSIVVNNPDFKGKISNEFFEKYFSEIEKLPNITPNGLLLPKRQNYISYNLIHMAVASIFQGLKFDQFADKIHVPVNIRIITGTASAEMKSRPRYTGKIHSDIWAGEPSQAIMVFIPLFGDLSQTGVEFFEPLEFPSEYMQPLKDFSEGAGLADDAVKYRDGFKAGCLFITDTFLLHRTMRIGGAPRLSIDFRFLARDILASDKYRESPRMANYILPEKWATVGIDRVLVSRENLEPFKDDDDNVKDSYATSFKLLKI